MTSFFVDFSEHKYFEITATVGEFTTKDGVKKKKYLKLGVIHDSKHGPILKLDLIPLQWDGYAFINEPYKKAIANPKNELDEDIPW